MKNKRLLCDVVWSLIYLFRAKMFHPQTAFDLRIHRHLVIKNKTTNEECLTQLIHRLNYYSRY